MSTRSLGVPSGYRAPSPSRHQPASRTRARDESRVTDPRLILIARKANGLFKRAVDISGALFALIIFSPIFAIVALLVWLQDRGPMVYAHTRVGRYGRPFRCLKFRSMVLNGDQVLQAHLAANPEAAEEWRKTFKLNNDPRVTWLGKFLRKSSLDELPQFWNVLKGEMSLVGPRPITRTELDRYSKERRYYLLVRPGITGLWQITGRSDSSYENRIKLDREYLEHWSYMRELWILFMTVPAVIAAKGAV